MPATVEVRFKGNRKAYFTWPDEGEPLRPADPVIVEVERGLDLGRVSAVGDLAAKKCASGCSGCAVGETPAPEKAVVRRATADEVHVAEDLRRSEEETRRTVLERVRNYGLEMKVSDAEWQWDRKRLTVYFTAEKRVDFRELVRDLAARLRTRIDLRQIGARDETKRLSGVGRCGREYCCSSWLPELSPVSLSLAKDQHLSLNPAQISGGCGRLLCCLKYEHEFYLAARKRFPKEGKTLRTLRGPERVVAVDILRERVFLRSEEQGHRIVALLTLQDELAQAAAAAPGPGADPTAPAASGAPAALQPEPESPPEIEMPSPSGVAPAGTAAPGQRPHRKRRRRRRGGSGPAGGPARPEGPGPES